MRRQLIALALTLTVAAACTSDDAGSTTTASPTVPDTTPVATGEPGTTPAPLPETTETTLPPTTTTVPLVTEGAVVMVANASGVNGAATVVTDRFAKLGFATVPPTNSAGPDDRLTISKIYFLPDGYQAALSIAAAMGGIEVFPMPTPAWISGGSEALGPTTVLVMLGDDRAIEPFPNLPG